MSKALATKNVAAVLLGLGMILSAFAFATPASAQTTSELQTQINALLAQIAALQGGNTSSTSCAFTFTANLKLGSKGTEVMNLQKFLNSMSDTKVAMSGAGSAGNETSTFGPATKAAVIKFQNKYAADILTPSGLSKGTGNWFAASRAKANALCASTPTTPTTPGTTPGTLSVGAGAQPANSLAPQGASRVPFTTITLTNSSAQAVTINGITVQRIGLGQDAVFSGIVLVDQNGLQVGVSRTLNSNHQTTVGDSWTLQPGQSQTLTVAGNMQTNLAAYAGQVVGLQVVGVNTTATVSGSLPVSGAMQTINATLAVGSVTVNSSSFDPNSHQTKNIGDTAVKFSGIRFTAGSAEDVKLFSVRWRQTGSASASDLANLVTVVNGTSYPATVSADGKYYTTVLTGGVLVAKGNSVDMYVQGDIVGGNAAGRSISFDIDRSSDVYFVGQTYGYGIQPTGSFGVISTASTHGSAAQASGQPFFQGSTFAVSGASVTTIAKANEVAAQNIAVNVTNQVLGGYIVDLKGESVSVQGHTFTVASSSATGGVLTNVTIVDQNGAVVAGPVDASGAGLATLTFSDTITYPSGRTIYTIKGKVSSNTTNGSTIQLSTDPNTWTNKTGQTSGNTVTFPSGTFTMNTMTVRTATLAVSVSPTPAAQTIVAGSQGVTLAELRFDATQSGEDVRFSSVAVTLAGSAAANLTTCQLFNGATALNTGSNVASITGNNGGGGVAQTITLDNQVVVTKGTVLTLAVKCNVNSGATGTYQLGMTGAQITALSATGVVSSNSVTATGVTGAGQIMTIGNSSLAVSLDASSPSVTVVAGGSTGVTLGAYKFRASNDNVQLQRVGLTLTSGNPQDLTQVSIYNGATLVGTAIFTGTNATSTLSVPVTLTKDTDVVLTIKGDIAQIGPSQPGTSGSLIRVDVNTNGTNTQGIGAGSGTTVNATGSTAVGGVRIYKSFPVVAQDTLSATGVADGRLIRFRVTANSAGSIGVDQIGYTITHANLSSIGNVRLFAYTDAGYSTPVTGQASDGQIGIAHSIVTSGTATSTVVSTNPIQVSAGQTVYFELRADVVPNTGASVVTRVSGDATAITPTAAATAEASNNFVWTPNTLGTSVRGVDNDFVNGANVIGLPSSGITQARGL